MNDDFFEIISPWLAPVLGVFLAIIYCLLLE
jgi:hypothetical protein